ncbi:MAG: flagellar biosynthesis protein FlaG [Alteromonadaceae bacterium]|nr:flagellar biosynthesis protein FlaG [Alteromonadaceae bacterium]
MAIDVTQTNLAVEVQNAQQALGARSAREIPDREVQDSEARSATLELAKRANDQRESVDNTDIETTSVSDIEIETAVAEISDFVQSQRRNLDFSYNENANRSVVQVTDTDTGELIRQIPSEEVLALSEKIRGQQFDVGEAVGVLFSREV